MKLGDSKEWIALEKVLEEDPYYVEVRNRELERNPDNPRPLNPPIQSDHLWKAALPKGAKPGSHLIQVEATDNYGRLHHDQRLIRIVE